MDLQKAISKLETEDFNTNDIRLILIMLREYVNSQSIFKELSHFVAHKKGRDQGEFQSRVEGLYCRLYVSLIMHYGFIHDYAKPPLAEVSKAIHFNAQLVPNDFLEKYKISKTNLIKLVKEYFPDKNIEKKFKMHDSDEFYSMITELMSVISIHHLFSGEEILKDFCEEILTNGFSLDIKKINTNKLLFTILLTLHDTELLSSTLNKKIGNLELKIADFNHKLVVALYANVEEISYSREMIEGFPASRITNSISFSFPIVQTDFLAKDWCSEAFIHHHTKEYDHINAQSKTQLVDTYLNEFGLLDIHSV